MQLATTVLDLLAAPKHRTRVARRWHSPYQGRPSTSFDGGTPSATHWRTARATASSGALALAIQRPRIWGLCQFGACVPKHVSQAAQRRAGSVKGGCATPGICALQSCESGCCWKA